jgi:hypothetical protein
MKTSQTRLSEERRQRSAAALEKHLADLFRRLPMLAGFTLREDLVALTDLAEERPDAVELLRGRTFARALH